ncbi:kinase-like domain, phloem protein 2-like protein, partial [Tanacetum coccineum]
IHNSPKHLAHLRIPLENIESATNFFAKENVTSTDENFTVYKGELCWSAELINISAWMLNSKELYREIEEQFWTEISMLSSLQHKNVASIVGFCVEVGAETIIYNSIHPRRMLANFLSDVTFLTWVKRLEICIGVAHALRYIHYDEPHNFRVIHGNINSETIILNEDGEPKESVSDDQDNKYLAPVAISHYRAKILDDIIDPGLWKQMDSQSFNVFADTAYECLNQEQPQSLNMDEIVTRLEKALEIQLECKNAKHSSVVDKVGGTSSGHEGSASHRTSIGVESNSSKKSMSSLKYLSQSQLSFEDLQSATNDFADQNIIREKTVEWVYQGRMSHSGEFIDIVARGNYPQYQKDEGKNFRMEKSMLSILNHTNLVSVIGFCEKNDLMVTVYKKEANGSLDKYLSDKTLIWMQRLKICLGFAKALSYIHYDVKRDFSVIHCNIKSSIILLDDKWESKLSGFKLSLKNTVARRHRLLLTRDIVKNAYVDPKYRTTGGVTHKSDVYSFGVVLFEVVCGRSAVLPDEELGEGLLSQLAKSHLDDMIDPHLRKQMDPESFNIFSETAYYCIQEERVKRPHIDFVVKRLAKALEHQWKRENPVDRTSFNRLKEGKNLKHLKIGLNCWDLII